MTESIDPIDYAIETATFPFLDLARYLVVHQGQRSFAELLTEVHQDAELDHNLVQGLSWENRLKLLETSGEALSLQLEQRMDNLSHQIHDMAMIAIHERAREKADEVLGAVFRLTQENGLDLSSWSAGSPFPGHSPDVSVDVSPFVRRYDYEGLGTVWHYWRYAWEIYVTRRM